MTMGYQCYLPRPPSPSHLLMLQIHISDSIWISGKQRSRNRSIAYPDHHWSSSTLQTVIAELACTVASYMRSECWYLLATLLPNPLGCAQISSGRLPRLTCVWLLIKGCHSGIDCGIFHCYLPL